MNKNVKHTKSNIHSTLQVSVNIMDGSIGSDVWPVLVRIILFGTEMTEVIPFPPVFIQEIKCISNFSNIFHEVQYKNSYSFNVIKQCIILRSM